MTKVKKILISLSFAIFYLLLAIAVPTNFEVVMPGVITKVESDIVIEGVENSSNFYTTAVLYAPRITPIMRIILELNDQNEVDEMAKFSKSISNMDEFRMGQVSKKYSYHTSIINAYKEASKVDNSISINYEINSLVLYYRPTKVKNLRIGDIITKVNGEPITEENYQEMIENTRKKEISLTIKRNENEFTYNHTFEKGDYYFIFYPNIEITSSTPKFSLPGLDSNTGGPSGGLIQSLNIYVSLLNLNFGKLKIAGTGTINLAGEVGEIGGAAQKIHTANRAKVDMYFIALGNHKEVKNIEKNFQYYPVKNFQEAVEILQEKIIN
jgi:PDZ domain-containing protein